jgi:hypothetical protein
VRRVTARAVHVGSTPFRPIRGERQFTEREEVFRLDPQAETMELVLA